MVMSEDLSNGEESSTSEDRDSSGLQDLECLECGQSGLSIKGLISHYKAHNSKATCHICKVTFQRVASLLTHLLNVHLPPNCDICHQRFSNAWELNKHSESHCLDSISLEGTLSSFAVSNPPIHAPNPLIPAKGNGRTGAYPSDHCSREGEHPEQAASLLQGAASYPTIHFQNPPIPVKGGGVQSGQATILSQGAISYPSIHFQNPPIPVKGGEVHPGQATILSQGAISYPSILFLNPLIPVKGHGGAGAYPTDQWARGVVLPGQPTSLSQGTISYPSIHLQNPPISDKGSGKHPGQVASLSQGTISYPSIHFQNLPIPLNGGGVHLGQATSVSQGTAGYPSIQLQNPPIEDKGSGVLLGQDNSRSQGTDSYPSIHMQNPPTPDKRSGVLPGQATSLPQGTVSYPSILLQNPPIPDNRSGVHPEQSTNLSQGAISYSSVNYSSLASTSEGSTNDLTDCKMASNSFQKYSPPNICSSYIAKDHSYCIPFDRQSQPASAIAQCTDTETVETTENTIEYIVGEDEDGYMETDGENSTNSETEDSQSNGSTTDTGSESFNCSSSDRAAATSKKHFFQCSVCQNLFVTMESLREHYTRLYSCTACGQLFSHWKTMKFHPCAQNSAAKACNICAESILNSCVICNAFFVSEDTLLSHIKSTHSSVVRNKLGTDTKAPALAVKSSLPTVSGTTAQAVESSLGHVLRSCNTSIPEASSADTHLSNGNLPVSKSYFGSLPTTVTSSVLPPSPSSSCPSLHPGTSEVVNRCSSSVVPSTVSHVVLQQSTNHHRTGLTNGQPKILPISKIQTRASSSPGTSPAPVCNGSTAAFSKDDAVAHQTNQPPGLMSIPAGATNKTSASATAQPVYSSAPPLTILAMFKNNSQEAALLKRMNTNWRSKVAYPCRHCGAVSRQPSLNITHRYLHRGRRSHQCQCGRAFKHQLHLLRHWVQHAEAASYICVNCGRTFTGAKLLAGHIMGNTRKAKSRWKCRVRKRCRMPFSCDCGQLFVRPSAYIWHQLKNRTKVKR